MTNYRDYDDYRQPQRSRGTGLSSLKLRLIVAAAIIGFSLLSYFSSGTPNPFTGEIQRVGGMTIDDEIQLGILAAPQMIQQHFGPSRDRNATAIVQEMGARLVNTLYHRLQESGRSLPYSFEFHLLNDDQTVNAFALPGGQVFITEAIYRKFNHPGQLAGVLGHEIGHVIERHGAQRMGLGKLWQGIGSAAGVAGGDVSSVRIAEAVGNLVTMKYGRADELEADGWGIELIVYLGYHPEHMLEVMDILEESTGGAGPPEFLSTHPRPENRRAHINQIIADRFPRGIPPDLR